MSDDPHLLTTLEQVREVIGDAHPRSANKVLDRLDDQCLEFLRRSRFALLATADADGRPDVSPKGDPAGFVVAPDTKTLLVPDRKGNRLIFGLQNILANPIVGLIFLIPGTEETLRVQGRAEITADPAILERLTVREQPALLAIRVHIDKCYFHCAKAFRRSELWRPDSWGERFKVSFGRQFARQLGGDQQMAEQIDEQIEESYRTGL